MAFDGYRFRQTDATLAPWLYLAHKARRGDVVAGELLTAFAVSLTDINGKSYWPVSETPA